MSKEEEQEKCEANGAFTEATDDKIQCRQEIVDSLSTKLKIVDGVKNPVEPVKKTKKKWYKKNKNDDHDNDKTLLNKPSAFEYLSNKRLISSSEEADNTKKQKNNAMDIDVDNRDIKEVDGEQSMDTEEAANIRDALLSKRMVIIPAKYSDITINPEQMTELEGMLIKIIMKIPLGEPYAHLVYNF